MIREINWEYREKIKGMLERMSYDDILNIADYCVELLDRIETEQDLDLTYGE